MILPGRLSSTTLGDILGALYRERADGVLELIEPSARGQSERRHRISFSRGLVHQIDTPLGAPRLGDLLRARGVLKADKLGEAVPSGGPVPFGRSLVNAALVSPEVVCVALRTQLRIRLEALFQISQAHVRFHVARQARTEGVRLIPLVPSEFLGGRPRFRDGQNANAPETAKPPESHPFANPPVSAAEKHQRFRLLAREHHPDRFPHATPEERERASERFSKLSAEFHRL